jgi:hypothetical protein
VSDNCVSLSDTAFVSDLPFSTLLLYNTFNGLVLLYGEFICATTIESNERRFFILFLLQFNRSAGRLIALKHKVVEPRPTSVNICTAFQSKSRLTDHVETPFQFSVLLFPLKTCYRPHKHAFLVSAETQKFRKSNAFHNVMAEERFRHNVMKCVALSELLSFS